jgi:hypothetical protein
LYVHPWQRKERNPASLVRATSQTRERADIGAMILNFVAPRMTMAMHLLTCILAAVQATSPYCVFENMSVALSPDATGSEATAAAELALWAGAMAAGRGGSPLPIVAPATVPAGRPHFAVGVGAALAAGLPVSKLDLDALGEEGFVASCGAASPRCVLAGAPNATRGSLYAVYHFLHAVGVRFFAPGATKVPHCPAALPVALTNLTFVPKFEYRAINGWAAMHDPVFARRSHLNDRAHLYSTWSATHDTDSNDGRLLERENSFRTWPDTPGTVSSAYAVGYFVHSIWNLLEAPPIDGGPRQGAGPPAKLFATHREWFSPSCPGPSAPCQVCWSNHSLVAALILATKSVLRAQPEARILSISQEDNLNFCKSEAEMAITNEEGSPAGPLLRAINQIAAAIAEEFPTVAIDTLAYAYAQQPPKLTSAGPNVIIRLCTNRVDFTQPLAAESNAPFREILNGWSARAKRMYLWHYVADFGNYLQVFPNYPPPLPNYPPDGYSSYSYVSIPRIAYRVRVRRAHGGAGIQVFPNFQVFPNYHTLGPDIQFLASNTSVVGMFEEGPGVGQNQHNTWGDEPTGPGSGTDMEELKDYLMSAMLWDPTQDPALVTAEFLGGFYGPAAAPHIHDYLHTMTAAALADTSLAVGPAFPWTPSTNNPWNWRSNGPTFLADFPRLLRANAAFAAAAAAAPLPAQKARVAKASMAILLPTLWRYDELHAFATNRSITWPLPPTKEAAFQLFASIYNASGTAGLINVNFSPCGVPGWAKAANGTPGWPQPGSCVYECSLLWLHECLFTLGGPAACPATGHVS